jgi:hypothetical protein
MHSNTFLSESGYKTRRFNDILTEIAGFFNVHRAEGTYPGGIHPELTSDDVTDCLDEVDDILDTQLSTRLRDGLRSSAQRRPVDLAGLPSHPVPTAGPLVGGCVREQAHGRRPDGDSTMVVRGPADGYANSSVFLSYARRRVVRTARTRALFVPSISSIRCLT